MISRTSLCGIGAVGLAAILLYWWRADARPAPAPREVESARERAAAKAPIAKADAPELAVDRSLPETAAALAIAGRVVDDAAEPIAGADVVLTERPKPGAGGSVERAVSDAEGRFSLAAKSGAEYALGATKRGFAAASTQGVRAGERDVLVRLGPGGVVFGTVLDAATRAPLSGFEVWSSSGGGYAVDGRHYRTETRVTTGADGAYRLEGVAIGYVTVFAERSSPPASAFRSTDVAADAPVELNFVMRAPTRFLGRVIEADSGAPVAGAIVTSRGSIPHPTAVTGPDGSFSIARYFPGGLDEVATLEAKAPGFAPAFVRALARSGAEEVPVDIRLEKAAIVTGLVIDTTGAPAAGLHVHLVPCSSEAAFASPEYERTTVRTDGEGRYFLGEVSTESEFFVRVDVPGAAGAISERMTLAPGERREVPPIAVGAPIVIRGRVTAPDGSGSRSARVVAKIDPDATAERAPHVLGHAAPDGTYRLEVRLAPASIGATAVLRLAAAGAEGAPSEERVVSARPGETVSDVDLALVEGFALEVLAAWRDSGGRRAAPQGRVSLAGAEDERTSHLNEAGRCRFDGVPAGTYRLSLGRGGSGREPEPPPVECEVEIPRDSLVRLVVDDEKRDTGGAADWGRVHFRVLDADTGVPLPAPCFGCRVVNGVLLNMHLGERGTPDEGYVVPVPPGRHLVSARGLDHTAAPPVEVEVAPGAVAGPVTLLAPRGISAEGVAYREDGAPAAFVTVTAEQAAAPPESARFHERPRQAITDADGRFVLRGLHRGRYVLSVETPNPSRHEVDITPTSPPLELK